MARRKHFTNMANAECSIEKGKCIMEYRIWSVGYRVRHLKARMRREQSTKYIKCGEYRMGFDKQ